MASAGGLGVLMLATLAWVDATSSSTLAACNATAAIPGDNTICKKCNEADHLLIQFAGDDGFNTNAFPVGECHDPDMITLSASTNTRFGSCSHTKCVKSIGVTSTSDSALNFDGNNGAQCSMICKFMMTGKLVPLAEGTTAPTTAPTAPTKAPTKEPTTAPTKEPTKAPTASTEAPTTKEPTKAPTKEPTTAPTEESAQSSRRLLNDGGGGDGDGDGDGGDGDGDGDGGSPTTAPTTKEPTTATTTNAPTAPTKAPTTSPTLAPTTSPTLAPTTKAPITAPTKSPTPAPTTKSPTAAPTTKAPTAGPTNVPAVDAEVECTFYKVVTCAPRAAFTQSVCTTCLETVDGQADPANCEAQCVKQDCTNSKEVRCSKIRYLGASGHSLVPTSRDGRCSDHPNACFMIAAIK